MARSPIGDKAMTAAERQRRHRANVVKAPKLTAGLDFSTPGARMQIIQALLAGGYALAETFFAELDHELTPLRVEQYRGELTQQIQATIDKAMAKRKAKAKTKTAA